MEICKNEIDILNNSSNFEKILTIPKFPIYMGCTNDNDDEYCDLEFIISKETGIIQIGKYPKNQYIKGPHNNAIGPKWDLLFEELTNLIIKYSKSNKKIYEIGGGSGKLFYRISSKIKFEEYIIYEPEPNFKDNDKRLEIIKEYFEKDSKIEKADIIIHSNLLEHMENPIEFLENISKQMTKDTIHIFAIPNMLDCFKKKYTTILNFEHKFFLTEDYVDILINNTNMNILEKKKLTDHSLIYVLNKIENEKKEIPNMYNEYKIILEDFKNHYNELIRKTNEKIKGKKNIYLFGGHIFSQFLICYGLNTENIEYIIDNDKQKQEKRLYGTNLIVKPAEYLREKEVNLILNVGPYKEEIMEQLKEINSKINYIIY